MSTMHPPYPRRSDPSADRSVSRIYSALRSEIRSGQITTEDLLSEYVLIPRFGATRNAVRAALKLLASEGILRRSPRSGTHLVHVPVRIEAQDDMPDMTLVAPERLDIETLGEALVRTPPWVEDRLTAAPPRIIRLEQLVRLDGAPIVWRLAFMAPPAKDPAGEAFFAAISRASGSAQPLQENFSILFGSPMGRIDATVEAVSADASTATVLDIEPGAPLISRELLFRNAADEVVAVGFQYCRGDRVAIVASF